MKRSSTRWIFLGELGEHGLQNQALWGDWANERDVAALVEQMAASLEVVQRERGDRALSVSAPWTAPYLRHALIRPGTREWLQAQRLGCEHRRQPAWQRSAQATLDRAHRR